MHISNAFLQLHFDDKTPDNAFRLFTFIYFPKSLPSLVKGRFSVLWLI